MIKVYKPGEKRKSVVVLRSVRRVAVTSCERGTPVCVVMTWAVRSRHELVLQQAGRRTSPCGAPRVARVEP